MTPTEHSNKAGGCFAKGTLVHIREGLRPIESLQVGDYVLSSPEDGTGQSEYKRVVNTFVHEDKAVRAVRSHTKGAVNVYQLVATGNQPFWVEGKGWTRAHEVKRGATVRQADAKAAAVLFNYPIYRTDAEGVGWLQLSKHIATCRGMRYDYANNQAVPVAPSWEYLSQDVFESKSRHLHVRVYNIEVEDFHTYYVGVNGVWVHNTNCKEKVELLKGTDKLPAPSIGRYASDKSLSEATVASKA